MAAESDRVIDALRHDAEKLKKLYHPEQLYLFGSHARGDALNSSDVDVVMVSASFENVRFLRRAVEVLDAIKPAYGIDLLCYTPEEFERKKREIGIVSASLRECIDLLN